MTTHINEFQAAWDDGELVFPKDPHAEQKRWFLRTPVNPANSRDLVFIGINPSSATQFAARKPGGDPTTKMVLKYFPVGEDGSPLDWRSMTILNLLPLIGQHRDLPCWDSGSGRQKILDSIDITRQILRVILPKCHCVHLMWGTPNKKKFPWKNTVLKQLIPEIDLLISADHQVQAYLSKKEHPLHPGFGGLAHWRGKQPHDAYHLLQHQ